ncbi:MAG: PD-(D/E)XK nuclease family protein, partial [Planctomycetes bacterium]|nr:PD-(D/E)XK nuclease family protein [Planctomycetota bacterium]
IKRLLTVGVDEGASGAVRPGDVAVVFRSLGDVDVLVREVFGRLGIPFVLESAQTLDRSTALAALVGLVRLDVEDWPFRGLLAVLSNNYFQPDWPEWQDGRAAAAAERAVRGLQIPRGRTRLLEQLAREADREADEDDVQHRSAEQRRRRARAALPLLARLEKLFASLPDRATLDEWADAWRRLARQTGLLGVVEADRPPVDDDSPQGRRRRARSTVPDQTAWDTLQGALRMGDKLSRLLGRAPAKLDRTEALAVLLDTLQSVSVGGGEDESGRVRVLSAASVRALRVPYLFLAGLREKSFPPPERSDRIYSEVECRRLIEEGLPLVARTERNREEMLLFYEVITRASRRLTFSYPAVDEAAQPLSSSPYLAEVEEACGPGRIPRTDVPSLSPIPVDDEPLTAAEFRVKAVSTGLEGNASLLAGLVSREPEAGLAESVLAGLRMVEARDDRRQFGPTEGIFAGTRARRDVASRFAPSKTFNATELEQYATCPYQFFLERVLRLEPLEALDLAVDYRARGRLVHKALADFHDRVNAFGGGPTSPAALDEEEYHRLLAETLEGLSEHAASTPLDAALYEIDLRLWAGWADDYRRQHESYDRAWQDSGVVLRPTWFEVSFGRPEAAPAPLSTEKPLELSTQEGAVRIAGRIDRIDTGTAGEQAVFNIVDYKTGASTRFSRDAVIAGTALQLPLYAMATGELLLADRQAAPWCAGYWHVTQKGFQPKQSLRMGNLRGDRIEPEPEWEELRQSVVSVVGALVEGIRKARFPVHSVDDQCGRFCPFRTICRINQVRSLEKTWQRTPSEA